MNEITFRFEANKGKECMCSFSDVFEYCHYLKKPPEIVQSLRQFSKFVFVKKTHARTHMHTKSCQ